MNYSRNALTAALFVAVIAPNFLCMPAHAQTQSIVGQKLYRWVGEDGKVHYSDDLPPEALTAARQELSKSTGLTLKDVSRAQTPEERAAAEAKAEADTKAQEAIDKAKQNDQVLLSSYPTEGDLKRAYEDRVDTQAETLKTTRMGLESQEDGMAGLLVGASNAELTGKPVPLQLAESIKTTHQRILDEQQQETQEIAEISGIRQEAASTLTRYRNLRSAAEAAHSESASPAAPAPAGSP